MLRVKWTSAGSMIKVSFTIVLSNSFGFSLADLWFPYDCRRYASKFWWMASALHSAGAPVIEIRFTSLQTSAVRMGFSYSNTAFALMCWLTCGPPIYLTTVAISQL